MLAGWETFCSGVNSLQLHAKNLDSRSSHLLLFLIDFTDMVIDNV